MQIEQRILLVDSDVSRSQKLGLLLEFLGETVENVGFSSLSERLSTSRYRSVIVDSALLQTEQAHLLLQSFAYQPIIAIGATTETQTNLVGQLTEPFHYNQLIEQLHHCQAYGRHSFAPTVPSSANTKLFRSLVGSSQGISRVRHLITQVAQSSANVLVTGESGTGKEVVARNIHYLSEHSSGPFIPVNCGAIPPDLLESELFGHEKGAFTGAVSTRKGRFELAQGGTLFLDEIGDMPLSMQVKILRVLQERCFERVGGSKSIQVDVRIIAATHRDLEKMIEEGQFREDLFYRLNVFPIEMPSLRERTDDIPLLLNELVCRLEKEQRGKVRFTKRAIDSLSGHSWSGNVRELSNLVERMAILCPDSLVDIYDLPSKYRHTAISEFTLDYPEELQERDALAALFSEDLPLDNPVVRASNELPAGGINLKDLLCEMEVDMIRQALEHSRGVVSHAAELLGMRRTTLVEKMRKYGLSK